MQAQTEQMAPHNITYHDALGMMMWLMKHADYHSQWPLWSVDTDIVPALIHGQSKLYFDEHRSPVGFATWAWLTDEAKVQVLEDTGPLEVNQWNQGDHLMFADFVAPWGHSLHILNDLRGHMFPEHRAFSIGRNPNGSIRKIYYWKGIRFKERIAAEQYNFNKTLWAEQA
ncbi:toxin-activating lysine-acyltransferase [Saccharospirillum impatiens]|uniref:toxin-activating lysine-acyltransferase n=1 Tax=Saccharospirillum impatiens TaxID=169438 RepID=UPI0004089E0D|nr:toxin-activating lysine-acyltransferase [Saccharospirillum impatiens]